MGSSGIFSDTTINTGVTTGSISYSSLNSTSTITINVDSHHTFSDSKFISLVLGETNNNVVTGYSNNYTYKILNVVNNGTSETLTLDRPTPNLSSLSGTAKVISNDAKIEFPSGSSTPTCLPPIPSPEEAHDPWTLDIVWGYKPIGFQITDDDPSKFTGSLKISAKEYLGYHSTEGQYFTDFVGTKITGTTFVNSFNEEIEVPASSQNVIGVVHYSENGDIINDPDRYYKFDDYLSDDTSYTEIYIPYIDYHRNTGSTIGAKFYMGLNEKYVVSTYNPTKSTIKYRDLLDEQNYKVGKIFRDKKVIVFDDQEIVTALDYKSNRRFTMPSPKLEYSHSYDNTYLLAGTTGQTLYISYAFEYTNDSNLNTYPLSNPISLSSDSATNVAIKFNGTNNFDFLQSSITNLKNGIVANKFYILAQVTNNNSLPLSHAWKKIDKTPGLNGNGLIDKSSLIGTTITLTYNDYYVGTPFILGTHMNTSYSGATSQFGDEQPFAGGIKVTRESSIEEMKLLVNLPSGKFVQSQNPSFQSGGTPAITEIALLDENKNTLAISKAANPITRVGAQVFAVKLDF